MASFIPAHRDKAGTDSLSFVKRLQVLEQHRQSSSKPWLAVGKIRECVSGSENNEKLGIKS